MAKNAKSRSLIYIHLFKNVFVIKLRPLGYEEKRKGRFPGDMNIKTLECLTAEIN